MISVNYLIFFNTITTQTIIVHSSSGNTCLMIIYTWLSLTLQLFRSRLTLHPTWQRNDCPTSLGSLNRLDTAITATNIFHLTKLSTTRTPASPNLSKWAQQVTLDTAIDKDIPINILHVYCKWRGCSQRIVIVDVIPCNLLLYPGLVYFISRWPLVHFPKNSGLTTFIFIFSGYQYPWHTTARVEGYQSTPDETWKQASSFHDAAHTRHLSNSTHVHH